METSSAGVITIDRTLALLEALVRDGGAQPLTAIAAQLDVPASTAHRMAALLVRRGLIARTRRGHYAAGLTLVDLGARRHPHQILAETARPLIRRLARDTRAIAHLGVLDGDMVTYLVKEGSRGPALFTREGGQLEAYCSAIGKVLLAHLDSHHREAYLAGGPFVALTARTVTKPERIRTMLQRVAENGFAVDEQEIAEGLFCIALPVRESRGRVVAAVSLSWHTAASGFSKPPPALRACARALTSRIGPMP